MRALISRRQIGIAVLAVIVLSLGVSRILLAHKALVTMQSDPKQWVMPNGNYSGWNYSALDQINLTNVKNLTVAWTFQIGILDTVEATPLVIGDTMYIVTPKPNYIYALDLKRDGVIKWEFRPEFPKMDDAIKAACCGAQTRGLAYADNKIFFSTLDGQVYAINAENGKVVWKADNGNLALAETVSAPPLIVGDKVVVGVMGGEKGVRGHVTAYNIDNGSMRWRFYSTGPNNEVGIGSKFKPFYKDDKAPNTALDSWYGDSWKRGGGSVWGWFTFDPELNLFYYGTGNCGPWNPDYRRQFGRIELDDKGGLAAYKNNYCASVLARDADTGELAWAYNLTPQDGWDLDEPSAFLVVDLQIGGRARKTLVHPARNGYFYVLDRATGELLLKPWAFVFNDLIKGVDMETGRPSYNMEKMLFTKLEDRQKYLPNAKDVNVTWCPGINARNWFPDAYSPRTGLVYTPALNTCSTQKVVEGKYAPPANYTLQEGPAPGTPGPMAPGATAAGELQANDPVTGKTVWRVPWKVANNVGVMATAGDLLFQGGPNEGVVRAFNAKTGEIVWSFRTGSNFRSSPISYQGPDGRQYVAIISSQLGNNTQVNLEGPADSDARFRRSGATLYVFALPRTR